jgi:hypothetical protein
MPEDEVKDANEGSPVAMPPFPKLDYPVPPRENMKLLLEHKKPLWVPVMFAENTFVQNPNDRERPFPLSESGTDWFGATWHFVESAGAQMVPPETHICPDPRDWREKLVFPDLDKIDFAKGKEDWIQVFDNSERMNMYALQNGMFERLLDISESEEVFVWLASEPEDVIEYANAMADYKIKLVDKIIENWVPIDFFSISDDWGTQNAPFMSTAMYARYFYEPTKRIADHIRARGYFVDMHSCGKLNDIVGYIANYADLWEGQPMNDHVALKRLYGDRLAFTIGLDPKVAENPNATEAELVAEVRRAIDLYGENGGMVLMSLGATPDSTAVIMNEAFEYSKKKYKGN